MPEMHRRLNRERIQHRLPWQDCHSRRSDGGCSQSDSISGETEFPILACAGTGAWPVRPDGAAQNFTRILERLTAQETAENARTRRRNNEFVDETALRRQ